MMYDYIIVGCGLAGISFAETAMQNGKSICVVNDNSQTSSSVAAGLYNPVILKRFTEVWQSESQLLLLKEFYSQLEAKLNVKLDYEIPLLRKYFSIEEQNNWFIASDKPGLANYLSTTIINKKWDAIDSPYGFGEVLRTGFIDTKTLIDSYTNYLCQINSYRSETFNYDRIVFHDDYIQYKDIHAKRIIFAEGFGMLSNPFFSTLPIDGAKGELLLVKIPGLKLDVIIKTSIFIIPVGDDLYKVGATYNFTDKTNALTEEGKEELLTELRHLIKCDFEVIEHYAGVRPTVNDRKPMLGAHPVYNNLYILNGLGTRGVMLAPAVAKMLFNHIEHQTELDAYVDIRRFRKAFKTLYHTKRKD